LAEILVDSFKDIIGIVPLIFIIFTVVDITIRKVNKNNELFEKFTKFDVLGGSIFGVIPQCGISVAFARMYTSGYITLGMLIAVFISCSDEALIIIGAHPEKLGLMLLVILIKVILAICFGYFINIVIKEKRNRIKACPIDCNCPRCKKHENIIINNAIHTLKITLYLFLTVLIINLGIDKLGIENLGAILGKNTFLQPIYASLIGMIPSCATSVLLAEGFIKGTIGFAALIAGLCANTGFGILIILKSLPLRRSLKIIAILQLFSIFVGEIIYIFGS
jgi:hypothetical protein